MDLNEEIKKFKKNIYSDYQEKYFLEYEKTEISLAQLGLFTEKKNKKILKNSKKKLNKLTQFFNAVSKFTEEIKSSIEKLGDDVSDEKLEKIKNELDKAMGNNLKKFIKKYTEVKNEEINLEE